jgi:hypothetical protein
MPGNRRSRPTLRCLTEDLGLNIPPLDRQVGLALARSVPEVPAMGWTSSESTPSKVRCDRGSEHAPGALVRDVLLRDLAAVLPELPGLLTEMQASGQLVLADTVVIACGRCGANLLAAISYELPLCQRTAGAYEWLVPY